MPSAAAVFVATLIVVLLACGVGVRVVVWKVAICLRNPPPSGPLRPGGPAGTGHPAVAAQRAEGTTAWTRISGGGF